MLQNFNIDLVVKQTTFIFISDFLVKFLQE